MPELSRFYGIIIRMYFDDHAPPHFHAAYGGEEAVVGIEGFDRVARTSTSARPGACGRVGLSPSSGTTGGLGPGKAVGVAREDRTTGVR